MKRLYKAIWLLLTLAMVNCMYLGFLRSHLAIKVASDRGYQGIQRCHMNPQWGRLKGGDPDQIQTIDRFIYASLLQCSGLPL